MLTLQAINNALQFLNRVTLNGPEAYTWVEAVNALQTAARAMESMQARGPGVPFAVPVVAPQMDLEI